jgi:hypothetical protein
VDLVNERSVGHKEAAKRVKTIQKIFYKEDLIQNKKSKAIIIESK